MRKFDLWIGRAWKLTKFGLIPLILAEKSSNDIVRGVGVVIGLFWFVITLPIQILLILPMGFCVLMAATYIGSEES